MARREAREAALAEELARLADLDAPALRRLWTERREAPAPASLGARLMRLALAWDAQAAAQGAGPPRAAREWARIAAARRAGACAAAATEGAAPPPAPEGTRLIRSWRGETHEVLVRADGVLWRGERHRSLSAVARAITGQNRNGPAFFGLRQEGAAR